MISRSKHKHKCILIEQSRRIVNNTSENTQLMQISLINASSSSWVKLTNDGYLTILKLKKRSLTINRTAIYYSKTFN